MAQFTFSKQPETHEFEQLVLSQFVHYQQTNTMETAPLKPALRIRVFSVDVDEEGGKNMRPAAAFM